MIKINDMSKAKIKDIAEKLQRELSIRELEVLRTYLSFPINPSNSYGMTGKGIEEDIKFMHKKLQEVFQKDSLKDIMNTYRRYENLLVMRGFTEEHTRLLHNCRIKFNVVQQQYFKEIGRDIS